MIKISPSKFVTLITKTLLLPCTNIMYFHARGRYICTWHLKRDVKGYPCSYFYSMQNSDRNWLIIRWISYVLRYVTKYVSLRYINWQKWYTFHFHGSAFLSLKKDCRKCGLLSHFSARYYIFRVFVVSRKIGVLGEDLARDATFRGTSIRCSIPGGN